MGDPLVSIVILTYNNPDVLLKCIESALALDYEECEIIVVDNASTDQTASIVEDQFSERVILVKQDENSPVAARNEGFARARGEFVLSLDHDMIIPDRQFLQKAVRLFHAFPATGLLSVKICGEARPQHALDEHWWYQTPIEAQDDFFFTAYFAEGAAFFRASALETSGGYDELFFHQFESLDLAFKLVKLGWRILYCPNLISIELVVSGHLSRRRTLSNYYSVRNRLWLAWKYYTLPRALIYSVPRVAVAGVRSVRFRWFNYFVTGLRDGIFAPAAIRDQRRPLHREEWAAHRRMEGTVVAWSDGS